MSFSYEADFNLMASRLTPITKRQDVRIAFLECMSKPVQWNRDNFFDSYIEGDSSLAWSSVTSYSRYDRVNYQNKIYEALEDNTNKTPATNPDYWYLAVNDFRGARERIKYNGQTIMLEWILNKWFATTFRQPSTGLDSDFYIVNNIRDGSTFTAYESETISGEYAASSAFQTESLTDQWVYESPNYSAGANFAVYYPIATISSTSDDKYFQMTSLVKQYKLMGSTVEYISY